MKIIKWLRKVTRLEPPRKPCAIAFNPTNMDETQPKEVVPFHHQKANQTQKRMAKIKLGCKNLNKMFTFSGILNRKTVHAMKMKDSMMSDKKLEAELIATVHVGNTQILPINDATITSSSTQKCGGPVENRDQIVETAKTKSFSEIKELVTWAAVTKAEKGGKCIPGKVLQYENREIIKAVITDEDDHDYRVSSGSPKISFRWDIESCSFTSSSVFSDATLSESSSTRSMDDINNINNKIPPLSDSYETRIGHWITTDSDFVVLEL